MPILCQPLGLFPPFEACERAELNHTENKAASTDIPKKKCAHNNPTQMRGNIVIVAHIQAADLRSPPTSRLALFFTVFTGGT